jgi:hypothetical protein
VDCTTLDPPTARALAGRVRAARIDAAAAAPPLPGLPAESPTLLDAPVTGGVVGADKGEARRATPEQQGHSQRHGGVSPPGACLRPAGTLSFLVGGEEAALPLVAPLLGAMGSKTIWWAHLATGGGAERGEREGSRVRGAGAACARPAAAPAQPLHGLVRLRPCSPRRAATCAGAATRATHRPPGCAPRWSRWGGGRGVRNV